MAESLIEKLEERIAKVREAFNAAYPAPQTQMAQVSEWWVVEVFDDYLIVESGDSLWKVPYTQDGDGVTFSPRADWEAVKRGYVAKALARKAHDTKAYVLAETDTHFTVGGYGVVFGGKDLEGETFSKDTDFWLDRLTRTPPVLYQHGRDEKVRTVPLGQGAIDDPDDIGLWVEAQIELAGKYAEAIRELVGKGLLGWSSGTAGHLAQRDGPRIKSWPIVEMSLTPTPAEPRTLGVSEIRSLSEWAAGLEGLLPQTEGDSVADTEEVAAPAETITETIIAQIETKETQMTEEIKQAAPTFTVDDMQKLVTEAVSKAMRDAPVIEKVLNIMPEETDRPETKSFADWLVAVTRRDTKRLKSVYAVKADLAEESGATGGYLVPPEYSSQILQMALGMSVVRPRARVIRMRGREFNVPALSYSGTTAGVAHQLGGLRTYWVAEGGTLTESEPTFEQIKLVANKLGGYTQITAELEEDAEGISDLLMQLFAQGIAFAEDYAFLNGDGANQPLGVFKSPALISEAAGANTFVLSDAASMMEKFLPSRQSGVWLAHPFALHEFIEMADGSGAANNLIWLSNTREAPPISFFGMPVVFTEAMPVLPAAAAAANKGGVLLADFGYYYIGDRGGLRIDYSEHFAFTSDLGTWRFIKRVDGQPAVSQAMYLADGTNQVSPFVTLAGA